MMIVPSFFTAPIVDTDHHSENSLFSCPFDQLSVNKSFCTGGRTITESDLVLFSAMTGDRHPQHNNAEWARASRFKERIAHGMLVVSYAVGLVPIDPKYAIALRSIGDAVFKRPVNIGDTIHVEGNATVLSPINEDVGIVGSSWRVINQRDDTVARVSVKILWRTVAGLQTNGTKDDRC